MKTKKRVTVIVSALFAVLCLAQTASAFYAPDLQRWVNRDPLGEPGFELLTRSQSPGHANKDIGAEVEISDDAVKLYCFVENKPTTEIDPFGLFLGFGYGKYCGWSRRGPGKPIDAVDEACQRHDDCLQGWGEACGFNFCNFKFLNEVHAADCKGNRACKRAKRKILIGGHVIVLIPPFIWM